ncbi:MAG: hypothetical protein PHP98_11660 [Kiritimatiellae bacterium]|nr:hypothetical protein [Kiritimatiellia bacterium]
MHRNFNLAAKKRTIKVGDEPLFGDASGVWNRRMGMRFVRNRRMGMRLLRLSNTVAAFGGPNSVMFFLLIFLENELSLISMLKTDWFNPEKKVERRIL